MLQWQWIKLWCVLFHGPITDKIIIVAFALLACCSDYVQTYYDAHVWAYITDKYIYVSHQSPTARKKNSNYLSKHDFMLMNWNVSQFFSCFNGCMNKNMKNIIISIFCSFLSCSAIEVMPFLFFSWLKSASAVHFCEARKSLEYFYFLMTKIFFVILFC